MNDKFYKSLFCLFVIYFASSNSACGGDERSFRCPKGDCIPWNWLCDGDDDCGDNADEQNCSKTWACGVQAPKSLIYKGEYAYHGQYPWLAKLFVYMNDTHGSSCGGSLISDQWLLTAAHCFEEEGKKLDKVKVYLGRHDFSKSSFEEYGSIYISSLIHIHPCYRDTNHDFALVKLPEKIQLKSHIHPICLPSNCDSKYSKSASSVDGCKQGETAGWGRRYDGDDRSDILKMAFMAVTSRNQCDEYYYRQSQDDEICTVGKAQSTTCQGDSGGPLMCRNNDSSMYLLGITSWGASSCEEGYPVYGRVCSVMSWIKSTMEGEKTSCGGGQATTVKQQQRSKPKVQSKAVKNSNFEILTILISILFFKSFSQ